MAIDQQEGPTTPQIQAPATTEQKVAGATSARDIGYGHRSARGHGYELRGLSYVPACTRAASGGCSGCRRSSPATSGSPRSPQLMLEETTGPTPELDNPQRHQHHLPRHHPHDALQHQTHRPPHTNS
jgi:hypothetical protein